MFDSLKHWFATLEDGSHLFEHADDEALHAALASLLYQVMSADRQAGAREKREFGRILKQEFALDAAQIEHLFESARVASGRPEEDLRTIAAHLKDKPAVRMIFMRKLLQLIDADGVRREELAVFYDALRGIFPEAQSQLPGKDV
jgi:uncharacterized tellurite resistance protein B-like protein